MRIKNKHRFLFFAVCMHIILKCDRKHRSYIMPLWLFAMEDAFVCRPWCCNRPQRIRLQSHEQSVSLPGGPITAGLRPLVRLGGEAEHSRALISRTQPANYNMIENT